MLPESEQDSAMRTAVAHILAAQSPYTHLDTQCLDSGATQKQIKNRPGMTSHDIFAEEVAKVTKAANREAYVFAMVELRNKAAHATRLFNRSLKHELKPMLRSFPLGSSYREIANMLDAHPGKSQWRLELAKLIKQFPEIRVAGQEQPLVSPETNMGFPQGWEDAALRGWLRKSVACTRDKRIHDSE